MSLALDAVPCQGNGGHDEPGNLMELQAEVRVAAHSVCQPHRSHSVEAEGLDRRRIHGQKCRAAPFGSEFPQAHVYSLVHFAKGC